MRNLITIKVVFLADVCIYNYTHAYMQEAMRSASLLYVCVEC